MGIKDKLRGIFARFLSFGLNASVTDVAKVVARDTGIFDENWVSETTIMVMNNLHKPFFLRTSKKDRVVLIPHCLRDVKRCKANIDEDGYHCKQCGACIISEIVSECKKNELRWFMVGGGSQAINIVKKHKPKAVVGVSCFNEAKIAIEKLSEMKIPTQAVLLSRAGCINTKVDIDKVKEKLRLPEKLEKMKRKR